VKVAHVIQRYWPCVGGAERYFQELSERLVSDGHQVTVYTTDIWDLEGFWACGKAIVPSKEEEHNGVLIRRFPVRHLPFSTLTFPLLRRLMALLSDLSIVPVGILHHLSTLTPWVPGFDWRLLTTEESYDLVHATCIPFDALIHAAWRMAQVRDMPFVMTPLVHVDEPGRRQVGKYYSMRHQIQMMHASDAVIVQTRLEGDYLASRGVPQERIIQIGMGVNPDALAGGDGGRFRQKHAIESPIVFCIGTAAYDKGTRHLVEAMRRLWHEGHDAVLVLAGQIMDHFRRYLDALPKEDRQRCHLLGVIGEGEKKDLLAAGDVLAMPSRTDSFGIVFLEAWTYKKPVIGARAGGPQEIIEHGGDGLLVPFGDVEALTREMARLLNDCDLARQLGMAGRQKTLERYTWDRVYAQVAGLYDELMVRRLNGRPS
jgi:glycosyltransferase involved in cell wall biosynthesis